MGFQVRIEADYGSEILSNYPSGGKAVEAFLMGLSGYDLTLTTGNRNSDPTLDKLDDWYRELERSTGVSLFPACRALVDCQWGDGGDHYDYRPDEYDLFLKRNPEFSEEQFQGYIDAHNKTWQPIGEVIKGVRLLVEVFTHNEIAPLEGFYVPEDSIPDFQALLANLELLANRKAQVVRLNFF